MTTTVTRKIIEIDEALCDGCGQCIVDCAESALKIVNGKAKLVADKYCDGLGACLRGCPTGALKLIERSADEFDEEAVEEYLSSKVQEEAPQEATMACGCPSTQIQAFAPSTSYEEANKPAVQSSVGSALSHWPVQIKLVPPIAPFLKGADLLVAADCTPVAYPNFHQDFLNGKVLMIGCPKFDDVQEYIQKFTDIFKTVDIKSITALIMEVPCCSGLPMIVKRAMDAAGKDIPMEEIAISTKGDILTREQKVAA